MGLFRAVCLGVVTMVAVAVVYQHFIARAEPSPDVPLSTALMEWVRPVPLTAPPPSPPPTTVIPLNIFQTWVTHDLPPRMAECVEALKRANPEFQHYLYDDNECLAFLKKNFDTDVVYAYQKLVPGAFKADLWRYCVLYIYGGVYLDIKYHCVNGFKLINLTDDEYFVMDRYQMLDKYAVYNAFMVVKPQNEILHQCIRKVVENVRSEFYGDNPLEITGPLMMVQFFTPNAKKKVKRLYFTDNDAIAYQGEYILKMYPEYRMEQQQTSPKPMYDTLWRKRSVYA
jgi:hypothetical protein